MYDFYYYFHDLQYARGVTLYALGGYPFNRRLLALASIVAQHQFM
jgi:hypothetical protein